MTAKQFRRFALKLPEAAESAHMGHPDFRIRGKIFATLGPDEDWGMVKLTPEQQAEFMHDEPDVYRPAAGAWGRWGCTIVELAVAEQRSVQEGLVAAWCNTAPKRLAQQYQRQLGLE